LGQLASEKVNKDLMSRGRGFDNAQDIGISNEEVSKIARDTTLPSHVRQKAIAEEKRRGLRNKQKRSSNSIAVLPFAVGAGLVGSGSYLIGISGGGGCYSTLMRQQMC